MYGCKKIEHNFVVFNFANIGLKRVLMYNNFDDGTSFAGNQ